MEALVNRHQLDRAIGCLTGLALGDALGMPTQTLARSEIRSLLGRVEGLRDAPAQNPVSRGLPAGHVTDDTDQALILARRLIAGSGTVDLERYVDDLLAWEREMAEAGSLDLLGPSTRRALALIEGGASITAAGLRGVTNGSAMRIAPVGVCSPISAMPMLVGRVVHVGRPTHGTSVANAAAAAVAAAVSVGIDGGRVAGAIELALGAARAAERIGVPIAGPTVSAQIDRSCTLADERPHDPLRAIEKQIGTGVAAIESVPAAFALVALYGDDPAGALLAAANLGGDADTIGAIVGAILGACHGTACLPGDLVARLHAVNPVLGEIPALSEALLAVRAATVA